MPPGFKQTQTQHNHNQPANTNVVAMDTAVSDPRPFIHPFSQQQRSEIPLQKPISMQTTGNTSASTNTNTTNAPTNSSIATVSATTSTPNTNQTYSLDSSKYTIVTSDYSHIKYQKKPINQNFIPKNKTQSVEIISLQRKQQSLPEITTIDNTNTNKMMKSQSYTNPAKNDEPIAIVLPDEDIGPFNQTKKEIDTLNVNHKCCFLFFLFLFFF